MPFELVRQNFSNLFNNTRSAYEIPFFQRAYSWEIEQLKTFFDDLTENRRFNKDFFIGSIITTNEYQTRNIKVIDGQQRITTCLLFFLHFLRFFMKRAGRFINRRHRRFSSDGRNINNEPVTLNSLKERYNQRLTQIFPTNASTGNFNFVLNPSKNDRYEWNEIFQEEFISANENINPIEMSENKKLAQGNYQLLGYTKPD